MANDHSKRARRRLNKRSRVSLRARLLALDPNTVNSPAKEMSKQARKYARYLRNLALLRSPYKNV